MMRKKLQVMHNARENFVKAECSDRVKRALRHKTRTFSDTNYSSGEQVYYKNPQKGKGWLGPATVMGQNGSLVLVQDGGFFYRVHKCRLLKVKDSEPCSQHTGTDLDEHDGTDQKTLHENISNSSIVDASESSEDDELVSNQTVQILNKM